MSNAWSHLPNTHHIDWVLDSLKENPKLWVAARDADRVVAWDAAWDAALDAALDADRVVARNAAWDAAWAEAWDTDMGAARSVISALVAYDDCDQFLSMSYEKLRVWVVLSEDHRALLLLPMIYVKELLNEQCMVTPA